MFAYWIFEFDCLFKKFDSRPLSGVLEETISMLNSTVSRDREAVDLIGRRLGRGGGDFKKVMNGEDDFAATDIKRLFELLWVHYAQSEGEALSDVGSQINNLDRISPLELGKCYQIPERSCGR